MSILVSVMCLVGALSFVYETVSFRSYVLQNVANIAHIIQTSTVAAITFNDTRAANETLATLRSQPNVIAACIVKNDGTIFSTYVRANSQVQCSFIVADASYLTSWFYYIKYIDYITFDAEKIGKLYLISDLRELHSRLLLVGLFMLVIFCGSVALGLGLSARMQGIITGPIIELAYTIRRVSESGDYSIRAKKETNDEVGVLIDGFNTMLGKIQEQNTHLRTLNQELQIQKNDLQASQQQFQSMIDNSPAIIFVKDLQNRFILVNQRFEALFHLKKKELIGKSGHAVFDLTKAAGFLRNDQEAIEKGKVIEREEVLEQEDGLHTYISTKFPLLDKAANPYAICEVATDITERKRREEAQLYLSQAAEDLAVTLDYEAILRKVTHLPIRRLADWTFLCIKKDWETGASMGGGRCLIGHPVSEQEQRANLELKERNFSDFHYFGVEKVMRTGISCLSAKNHLRDSSDTKIAHMPFGYLGLSSYMTLALRSRNEIFGTLTFISNRRDLRFGEQELNLAQELVGSASAAIDNSLLYKKAQERVQEREDFLSIAAHELRTPLTPLKLQIGLLGQIIRTESYLEMPRDKIKSIVANSDEQVDRLTNLVNILLDLSRIRIGELKLERKKMNLNELVKSVISRYTSVASRAKYTIKFLAKSEVVGMWDPLRIEQVVTNLLTNAIKYGNNKDILLEVSKDERFAQLSVKDYGIGIARNDQFRIFQRFERAVSVLNIGGFGLGLYITRQIIEAHGGRISIESELGLGSEFIVNLPLDSIE